MTADSPKAALVRTIRRKLTKTDVELLADFIARTRCTEKEACLALGIHYKQWDTYKTRHLTVAGFDDIIARIKAIDEEVLIDRIRLAGTTGNRPDWRAIAWYLERTRPDKYSQNGQQSSGPAIVMNVALVNGACDQILKLMQQRQPKQLDAPVGDTADQSKEQNEGR